MRRAMADRETTASHLRGLGKALRPLNSIRPAPPLPPYDEPAPLAAHQGELVGKHQQAERDHPEAQNRQEAENAEEDQHDADRDPEATRTGHGELTAEHRDFPRRCLVVACCSHVES